jgi:hypothetical protein|tara:strand:- start:179 stop:553 length:375 start_codon:yes stop_codon:yes gene_type:complete
MAGRYDHPNHLVRREQCMGGVTAGTSDARVALFSPFQKMRLMSVQGVIETAGTAANTYVIQNGTTSIGTLAVGTDTAGAIVASGSLGTTIAKGARVNLKTATTDATGVAIITYEWEVLPDAVLT